MRGGLVTAASQGAMVVIQLAAVPALTRLLDPRDFGLVAMITVFTGFAAMFVDAGLSMATVQREHINQATGEQLVLAFINVGIAGDAMSWRVSPPLHGSITSRD